MAVNTALAKETLLEIIDAYTASLTTVKVKLFSNNIVPTVNSVIGDFVECTFTGYSAFNVDGWTSPAWFGQGAAVEFVTGTPTFNTASPYTIGEVVYGWYIVAGATPALLAAGTFPNPIAMNAVGDQIIVATPLGISDALIPGTVY